MKTAVIFCVVLAIGLAQAVPFIARRGLPPADPPNARARAPVWGNILQKLDHFNPADTRTWNMRYMYNNQFYKPGGPIFIMLGAEWTIDGGFLQTGQMYDMAEEHNGYMFYTEHRYYGESHPTSDLSPDNLKYLSTPLALHDVAVFIQTMKAQMPALADAKVIVVGGSYGGSMSLWMREKYPTLVHAAVSSSAPVFAKAQFEEYHQVVADALGPNCASVISRAIDQIKQKLITSAGQAQVQKDYNTCVLITPNNALDLWYFFTSLAGGIGGKIQYADANTVNEICSVLEDTSLGSEYNRLAKLTESYYCKSSYFDLVNAMVGWAYNGDSRQWFYQTCTEYGYYQTSSLSTSLYRDTIPLVLYQKWCLDFFGPEFTPQRTDQGTAATNNNYGGYNPQVTRVISVHGTTDPWHSIGLSKDVNSEAPVIIVKGTSHCADLNSISWNDSAEMKQAKTLVQDWVRYWLSLP